MCHGLPTNATSRATDLGVDRIIGKHFKIRPTLHMWHIYPQVAYTHDLIIGMSELYCYLSAKCISWMDVLGPIPCKVQSSCTTNVDSAFMLEIKQLVPCFGADIRDTEQNACDLTKRVRGMSTDPEKH